MKRKVDDGEIDAAILGVEREKMSNVGVKEEEEEIGIGKKHVADGVIESAILDRKGTGVGKEAVAAHDGVMKDEDDALEEEDVDANVNEEEEEEEHEDEDEPEEMRGRGGRRG